MLNLRIKKAVDGSNVFFVMFGGYNLGVGKTAQEAISACEKTVNEMVEDLEKLKKENG